MVMMFLEILSLLYSSVKYFTKKKKKRLRVFNFIFFSNGLYFFPHKF